MRLNVKPCQRLKDVQIGHRCDSGSWRTSAVDSVGWHPMTSYTEEGFCYAFNLKMANRSVADKLCSASASGKLPEVLSLLKNGADVNGINTYKRTALQVVMLGSVDVIEALLQAEADPNLRDPTCGLTVTHDAAREGFADSVRVLLAHGADANLADKWGNLPLHLAAREGHLEAVRLLVGRTADPQRANGLGETAGRLARQRNRMDIAKYIDEHQSSN